MGRSALGLWGLVGLSGAPPCSSRVGCGVRPVCMWVDPGAAVCLLTARRDAIDEDHAPRGDPDQGRGPWVEDHAPCDPAQGRARALHGKALGFVRWSRQRVLHQEACHGVRGVEAHDAAPEVMRHRHCLRPIGKLECFAVVRLESGRGARRGERERNEESESTTPASHGEAPIFWGTFSCVPPPLLAPSRKIWMCVRLKGYPECAPRQKPYASTFANHASKKVAHDARR